MNAYDGLFAAKGDAQPVDQARRIQDPPSEPKAGTSTEAETKQLPLTDLFGEPVHQETTEASSVIDGNPANDEPPPAASLLTIASQRSAARRRISSPEKPDIPTPGKAGDGATETDALPTANLPVPVRIQLPIRIGPAPAGAKRPWDRRIAALAASVAISLAGAATILIAGSGGKVVETATRPPVSTSAGIPLSADASPGSVVTGMSTAPIGDAADGATASVIPEPVKTTIQSVRIDANGRAVITGEGPPDATLIVLHNRQPIGTVTSDIGGLWNFSSRVPARTNRNEFSVVPMRIDNSVMVTDLPAVPRPGRRPPAPSFYFAQIASLPSAADAGREAEKLGDRLAGIVARDRISVRAATIENGRKVYRVTISGFPTKAGAANICSQVRARNARCLVMQGS